MSDMDYPENSLDRQEPISQEFNEKSNGVSEEDVAEQGDGSEMVQDEMPRNDMQPPEEMRQEVDRESYNERLGAEFDKAAEEQEAAKEEYLEKVASSMEQGQHEGQGMDNAPSNDYDMGR